MALSQAGVQLIAQGIGDFVSNMTKADKAVSDFGANGSRSTGAAGQIMTGALRQVGAAAVNFALQGAQAIGGFVADSIKKAGDFDAGMAQFQIAVGRTMEGSGQSLDTFRQLFINLGKELPVSTTEVQQAAIEMSKGGIEPATLAAGGLRDTINFAAAALKGDLVSASDIAAKTMQAWTSVTDSAATKTQFLAHAEDVMTQATTAASTTVPQLFEGLSNVGGSARLTGLSFDETTTALAQLTPSFASSADAGTSFKVFLQSLLPHTKSHIQAMEDLGLYTKETGSAFFDASGKFVGMQRAEELLQHATQGLTNEQRQQYLQTIFGTDAIRAASVFATQGAAGYDALATSISKQSTVAQAAAIVHKTFATSLENAKGSVEALQITVGSALIPILTSLLNNTITPLINKITDFVAGVTNANIPLQTLKNVLSGIGDSAKNMQALQDALTKAFGPDVASVITTIASAIGSVVQAAQPLVDIIKNNLQPILISVGAIITGSVIVALAGLVAPLLAPIAIITALVAIGAVLVNAWNSNFGGIRDIVTNVFNNVLMPAFQQAATWVGQNLPAATQTLTAIWNGVLLPAIQAVWGFISGTLIPIISALYSVEFAALGKAIQVVSAIVTNVIIPALKDLVSKVESNQTVMNVLRGIAHGLGDAFNWISQKAQDLVGWLNSVASAIRKISIPSWAQGHSPPPLADWFTFIADSVSKTVDSLSGLEQQLLALDSVDSKVKKVIDDLRNLQKESLQATADMAGIAMGNLSYVFGLGDVSQERQNQQSLQDENAKNLAQQAQLQDQIENLQVQYEASGESNVSIYNQLIAAQSQLNQLQYMYSYNQSGIQENQQKINEITELTADAQQRLADAQQQAGEYAKIDAKLGQDYYKMQSDYIQQLEDLKKKQIEAQSSDEAQMYQQQIDLLNQQHDANMQLFGVEAQQRSDQLSQMSDDAQKAANATGDATAAAIVQAISNQEASIAQAISDAMLQAITAAQKSLEISSPSKLVYRKLGVPFMQGITKAMTDSTDHVSSALNYAMTSPIASASQIMNTNSGNTQTTYSPTYNYSPTYQSAPVAPQQDFYLMQAGVLPV